MSGSINYDFSNSFISLTNLKKDIVNYAICYNPDKFKDFNGSFNLEDSTFQKIFERIEERRFGSLVKQILRHHSVAHNELISSFPITTEVIWKFARMGYDCSFLLPRLEKGVPIEILDKNYSKMIDEFFSKARMQKRKVPEFKQGQYEFFLGIPVYNFTLDKKKKYKTIWDLREETPPRFEI